MKLAELQAKFQAGILGHNQTVLASIRDSHGANRATLFAIYYDSYRLRLAEFLSNDFPVLRNYLGEEMFGRLVEEYIESTPSRHRNARWYSTRLRDFMCETAPWQNSPNAIDLAQLEGALADVFDAADAPLVGVESLRKISLEDCPNLVLEFHPSVMLIDLGAGTAEIYEALAWGREPQKTKAGRISILLWRNEGQTRYRRLEEDECLALREAKERKRLAEICAHMAFQANHKAASERAASFLSQWFADGLIVRSSVSDDAKKGD